MTANQRILLFTGGNIGAWALSEIQEGDILIGVDRGALFLVEHDREPDIAIGDFDSVTDEQRKRIRLHSRDFLTCDPVMKDETDTEMAFNWALEQSPGEIVILGGLGSRFDHSLANVHLLLRGLRASIPCRLRDENNEVQLMDKQLWISKKHFTHASLLPLSMQVTGITLSGFQYPLHKATLNMGESLGISNVIVDQAGRIEIDSGLLLVISSKD